MLMIFILSNMYFMSFAVNFLKFKKLKTCQKVKKTQIRLLLSYYDKHFVNSSLDNQHFI